MGKSLIIVESPAKVKTIKKFLGPKYVVKASVGHVIDLPKSKLGIDIEEDFTPNYITIRGKGPVLKELKKEAKKADKIFLATDPDREGEAISWHLKNALEKEQKNIKRIEFNEITKDAIKKAIKNPREINDNLVNSQQARRVLDRLVGYQISPLLWQKIRRGLSAGRVQSVASKIIKDREVEIKKFKPEEYWSLTLEALKDSKKIESKFLKDFNGNKELKNEEAVKNIINSLDDNLIVKDIKRGKKRKSPYKVFTTSTLQQEASNKLNFSTKKTMALAQSLYEGVSIKSKGTIGLITYIRTDSTRVSSEAEENIKNYIKEEFGDKYLSKKANENKSKKNSQDAHEAIRPTDIFITPNLAKESLKRDEYRLYKMIWERTVAFFMEQSIHNTLNITLDSGGNTFKANGSILDFDGFLKVYSYASTSKDTLLPEVNVGDELKINEINPKQHFTQPPPRFTEASLVKLMEELGIGRPSTYSPTISTIISRGYVKKEEKHLVPTELGVLVTEVLEEFFKEIMDVNFTADLENKLDDVEAGDVNWKDIIKNFYSSFEKMLENAKEHMEEIDMTEETDEVCDECGEPMLIKYGRYGKFMACSKYPDCKFTKPIQDKIGVKCPKCKAGDILRRKSKKGRMFFGCNKYPECEFISWLEPTGDNCPKCSSALVLKKTKKKEEIICSNNKECDFKK